MIIAVTINDKEYHGKEGQTVMELAQANDIYIPHFCWHPGLSVAGVCRFCMVQVEGRPKLEIACNLPLSAGMKIYTNNEQVQEAHKWALEFHLINHPLDCPICDQAGECGLQDYYMQVGKYRSQMRQDKVLKPKKLNVGVDLVLDTERCILCSLCVRFEEEVTKTSALGIFDRGDRSIIGTYKDKKINHNYTTNLVDICPVGAFTSKDFRFQKRVWLTQEVESICLGCSTGCAITIAHNSDLNRFYRIKPRISDVNGHWLCNFGREMYKHLNVEHRLLSSYRKSDEEGEKQAMQATATTQILQSLREKLAQAKRVGLLVSSQYTNEEYRKLFSFFITQLGSKSVWLWRSQEEDINAFDGILQRGDKNPNTQGLLKILSEFGIEKQPQNEFEDFCAASHDIAIVLTPEVFTTFTNMEQQLRRLSALPFVSLWSAAKTVLTYNYEQVVALKCFAEKTGHYYNYAGQKRELSQSVTPIGKNIVDVCEAVSLLAEER